MSSSHLYTFYFLFLLYQLGLLIPSFFNIYFLGFICWLWRIFIVVLGFLYLQQVGLLFIVIYGLLIVVACLVEQRLCACRLQPLQCVGSVAMSRGRQSAGSVFVAQASLLLGVRHLPGPGIEPVSPELAGLFSIPELPGKSLVISLILAGQKNQQGRQNLLFLETSEDFCKFTTRWPDLICVGKGLEGTSVTFLHLSTLPLPEI